MRAHDREHAARDELRRQLRLDRDLTEGLRPPVVQQPRETPAEGRAAALDLRPSLSGASRRSPRAHSGSSSRKPRKTTSPARTRSRQHGVKRHSPSSAAHPSAQGPQRRASAEHRRPMGTQRRHLESARAPHHGPAEEPASRRPDSGRSPGTPSLALSASPANLPVPWAAPSDPSLLPQLLLLSRLTSLCVLIFSTEPPAPCPGTEEPQRKRYRWREVAEEEEAMDAKRARTRGHACTPLPARAAHAVTASTDPRSRLDSTHPPAPRRHRP